MFDSFEEMPPREVGDGNVNVEWRGDSLVVSSTQDNNTSCVKLSRFNALRVFGLMSLMLGIKLPSRVAKKIVL